LRLVRPFSEQGKLRMFHDYPRTTRSFVSIMARRHRFPG
jgi:hypothetical protein